MKMNLTPIVMGIALLLTSSAVLAEGTYLGVGIGQSNMEVDFNNFDGDDTGYKIFGGYRYNDNIAIEVFYTDFGEPDDGVLSIDANAFGIAGVGILPLNNQFELFGKVGFASWDAEFRGPGAFNDDGTDLIYGIGVAYISNSNFSVRGEWEIYDIQSDAGGFDVDTDMLSISAQFNF